MSDTSIAWKDDVIGHIDQWPQRTPQPSLDFLKGIATDDLETSTDLTAKMIELWPGPVLYSVVAGWLDDISRRLSDIEYKKLPCPKKATPIIEDAKRLFQTAQPGFSRYDPAEIDWASLLTSGWRGSQQEAVLWRSMEKAVRACAILDRAATRKPASLN